VIAEFLFGHGGTVRIAAEKTAEKTAQPAAGEKAAQAASLSATTEKAAEPSPSPAALPHAGSEQRKKRNAQRFGHSSAGYPRTEDVIEQTHDPGSFVV
jgi:hypothetical protein